MPFVLDASVTLSWVFPGEQHPVATQAARLLEPSADAAFVPTLWWYEIRNVLIVNERRGLISPAGTAAFLSHLADLRITMDSSEDDRLLIDLSRQYRLSIYDAAYLELAIREQIPLATLDKPLQLAARSAGIPAFV